MDFASKVLSCQEINKLGDLILDVYRNYGIKLDPRSEIAHYVNSAKRLASSWETGDKTITRDSRQFATILLECLKCVRVGEAIKLAKKKPNLQPFLKKMLKGQIDPTDKKRTLAKDFWFEISVLARLQLAGIHADLIEPPDIQIIMGGRKLGIACKCAYSESNLGKQFRKAKNQIARSGEKGIIAICVDALLDHSELVIAPDVRELHGRVTGQIEGLLRRHARLLPTWINSRNVIGIVLFASTLSIVEEGNTPREGQHAFVVNRCSRDSPYWQVVDEFGDKLMDARF